METDASVAGVGAVLSQRQIDEQVHPVAYASRSLLSAEQRYSITELETLAVVWAISHFHPYLYGHSVVVYTDHAAVRAVLESSNPSAKHVRWWTRVYGSGIRNLKIMYRPGKSNANADALSRSPGFPAPVKGIAEDEYQVLVIQSKSQLVEESTVTDLLTANGKVVPQGSFSVEQRHDSELKQMIKYVEQGSLPTDPEQARRITLLSPLYSLQNGVLFLVDVKNKGRPRLRAAVPRHLRARNITVDQWVRTSQVIDSSQSPLLSGGGKACTVTVSTLSRTPQNVPLFLVVGNPVDHRCIQYQ